MIIPAGLPGCMVGWLAEFAAAEHWRPLQSELGRSEVAPQPGATQLWL